MKRIYVGNLNLLTNANQVQTLFESYGRVLRAGIMRSHNTGSSLGFAYVLMSNDREGNEAIQKLTADLKKNTDAVQPLIKRVDVGKEIIRIVYKVPLRPFVKAPPGGQLQDCWLSQRENTKICVVCQAIRGSGRPPARWRTLAD